MQWQKENGKAWKEDECFSRVVDAWIAGVEEERKDFESAFPGPRT
jgi:hypothetical protein